MESKYQERVNKQRIPTNQELKMMLFTYLMSGVSVLLIIVVLILTII